MKIATMFIKSTFKDLKKVKRIKNYVLKCNLYILGRGPFCTTIRDNEPE